jgi:myo-inositol-1(or 4)-monophosphatase
MPLAGTPAGQRDIGPGAGGDRTVYLDQLAEDIALRHLERAYRSGRRFRLLSEEIGERDFGGDELVLLDPLDGSLNARQGVPYFAIMLAAAAGERLQDVRTAYVANLVTGDEFTAEAGLGAARGSGRISAADPGSDRFGIIQLDAPSFPAAVERAQPLTREAERVRILGSAALNLCLTASGVISLQCAPLPVRAFDLAGPLLILREAGGTVSDLDGRSIDAVSTALDSRTTVLASASARLHARALALLRGES